MIVVIIAGGSGTRLWPLSTPDFPKQLLKLTNDKSMVQNDALPIFRSEERRVTNSPIL
jgi:mannose-1-phosphate guanylyltransferase